MYIVQLEPQTAKGSCPGARGVHAGRRPRGRSRTEKGLKEPGEWLPDWTLFDPGRARVCVIASFTPMYLVTLSTASAVCLAAFQVPGMR